MLSQGTTQRMVRHTRGMLRVMLLSVSRGEQPSLRNLKSWSIRDAYIPPVVEVPQPKLVRETPQVQRRRNTIQAWPSQYFPCLSVYLRADRCYHICPWLCARHVLLGLRCIESCICSGAAPRMNCETAHRKDLLLRLLRKMKAVHGEVYDFHPDSYLLPTEYTKFIHAFTRLQQQPVRNHTVPYRTVHQ